MWLSWNELKLNNIKHLSPGCTPHIRRMQRRTFPSFQKALSGSIDLEHFIAWLKIGLGSDTLGFDSCVCCVTLDKLVLLSLRVLIWNKKMVKDPVSSFFSQLLTDIASFHKNKNLISLFWFFFLSIWNGRLNFSFFSLLPPWESGI